MDHAAVYQVKDAAGRVYRTTATSPEAAMQQVANRHNVAVVAWRESKAAQDSIYVGLPRGARF
jgi:hypothetical protein